MTDSDIKAFYSPNITFRFFYSYGSIALIILIFEVVAFHYADNRPTLWVTWVTMSSFVGGFWILQRYKPTRISIHPHNYFYVVRNVESVIEELPIIIGQERNFYGFSHGYKKVENGDSSVSFIPVGKLYGTDDSFYKSMIEKVTLFSGTTGIVEVKKDNDGALIYGPYFTLKKIYDEIW